MVINLPHNRRHNNFYNNDFYIVLQFPNSIQDQNDQQNFNRQDFSNAIDFLPSSFCGEYFYIYLRNVADYFNDFPRVPYYQ